MNAKLTPASRRYLLRETLLLLGLVYLVFFGGTGGGLQGKSTLMLTSGLLTLLAAAWVFLPAGGGNRLISPLLQWALAVFLLVQLAAALLGIDPARSLPEVWLYAIEGFLLLLAARLVGRGWPPELFVKALLIVGAVVSLFAWSGAILWYRGWLAAAPGEWIPAVSFRLPAANMLAVVLNLLLMAALARIPVSRRPAQVLLGLYALSTMVLLYLTSSRSGWLGTAAGLGTLGLLYLGQLKRYGLRLLQLLRRRRWLWAPLALILLAALAAGGYLLYKQAMHPTHGNIFTARSEFWPPAWEAFRAHPLLGTGPFTFSSYYLGANSVPPRLLFVYAHNLYLDVLHGSGLMGFAAFAVLAFLIGRGLLRTRKIALDPQVRAVATAGLAGLAAFGVHGLFDSVHHTEPLCAMLLALLLGAGLGRPPVTLAMPRLVVGGVGGPSTNAAETAAARMHEYRAPEPRKGRSKYRQESTSSHEENRASVSPRLPVTASPRLRISASIFLPLLLAAFGWYRLWALWPLWDAAEAGNTGDWPAAVSAYEEAARRNPGLAPAWHGLGLSLAQAGRLDEAIAAFERTLELDPYFALHWANLAAAYLRSGNPAAAYLRSGNATEAADALQAAVERAPQSALFWLQLGEAEEAAGEGEAAAQAYRQAVELDARLAAAYAEQFAPAADRLNEALAEAAAQDTPRSIPTLIANLADNPDQPAAYLALAEALLAGGGDLEQAAEVLRRAPFAYYGSTQDYLRLMALQARLAAAQGDAEGAADLLGRVEATRRAWGPYGPGAFGVRLVAPYAYRAPFMRLEWLQPVGAK